MGLGCREGAAVHAQLSPRILRWRRCEGSLGMCEMCGPDTPTLSAACRRLRGAGTRSQQGRSDGPRGSGLGTGGRGSPPLAVSPVNPGCPSARVPPHP